VPAFDALKNFQMSQEQIWSQNYGCNDRLEMAGKLIWWDKNLS